MLSRNSYLYIKNKPKKVVEIDYASQLLWFWSLKVFVSSTKNKFPIVFFFLFSPWIHSSPIIKAYLYLSSLLVFTSETYGKHTDTYPVAFLDKSLWKTGATAIEQTWCLSSYRTSSPGGLLASFVFESNSLQLCCLYWQKTHQSCSSYGRCALCLR